MYDLAENSIPFLQLGQLLQRADILTQYVEPAIARQHQQNPWFTPQFCHAAIHDISRLLTENSLNSLISNARNCCHGKTIAVVPAGDIPLQCFPTFLHILLSGNQFVCKLSTHDNILLPVIANLLFQIKPTWKDRIFFVQKISNCDAIIADIDEDQRTAFESYFKEKPHLLRIQHSRTAILTGYESRQELTGIANDIYRYFGKGPQAIKKLLVPSNYNFIPLLNIVNKVSQPIANHNQFLNNLEYQKAVHLINKRFYMDAGTFLFIEDTSCNPPTAVVNYEYYHNQPAPASSVEPTVLQLLEKIS